jgi:hypothetical protein
MSDTKHSDQIITNESTRLRRDWIDRAISSVRGKAQDDDAAGEFREQAPKPDLYVVNSGRAR